MPSSSLPMFRSRFILALCLIALFSSAWGAGTVELTEESLNSIEKDTWLVEYYSPNCTFCKRLAPIWEKLVETEGDALTKSRFFFGKIDCVANESICEKNKIDGYPTILLYNKGKLVEEFADEHTYEAILAYVSSKAAEYKPAEVENSKTVDDGAPLKVNGSKTAVTSKPNPDGIVVPLTPTNFSSNTSKGPWFVKFYAPWCGHCQALAPIWVEVGEALRGKINVAEVNCEMYGQFCSTEEIRSYPTIKFIQEGSVTLYDGGRTLEALSNFAIGLTGTDIGQISVANAHDITQNDVAFIYFHNKESPKAYLDSIYAISAKVGLQSQFYVTEDPAIAKNLDVTEVPALVAYKNGQAKAYTGPFEDVKGLSRWIWQEKLPILVQLDSDTSEEILNTPGYVVLGILNPGAPNFAQQKAILKEAAIARYHQPDNHKKARVIFSWVDGHNWLSYVYRTFGLNTDAFPSVVILKTWLF
ncbi:thioredoxin-domain-containing protein [Basidiobolus meristosporus CBS 931.73]|uniref:Thioredoxin-domain-containing protein n=1 Tax=Basidiobolus meristosporus CBS 931.73 TaxID=1314790 RepID=A0A1Y1XGT8_9FUNG|nr:thioredoxin-domain-containing protein [Basidiobolus meristosporus CBS 931.73]|eukprot:ORX84912.1 thioredoxin-domain-containing protein [Basidiobolus meristosporus CBS 931.73]